VQGKDQKESSVQKQDTNKQGTAQKQGKDKKETSVQKQDTNKQGTMQRQDSVFDTLVNCRDLL
jgi:hypothetical protein